MGLTLYHCHNARSFRALWGLEELGLTYELVMLPFPPRVHARDYLKINPLGTIPYFIDGETRMTESAAIAEYLAAKYGGGRLAVAQDEPAFGAYLNGLHYGEATLTFPQTLVLRYTRLEPEERRQPQVASDYAKWFLGRLRALQTILETADYVAANRFTAADISVAYALLLAGSLDIPLPDWVAPYWDRMQARDGYRRAQAAQKAAAEAQGFRTAPLSTL